MIGIQLEAFRRNDEQNRGIALAFRFASPANRAHTSVIKEGPHAVMLDFREPTYGPVETASIRLANASR